MAGFWPDLRFAVRQLAESLVGLHVEGHAARLASEACLVPRLQITKKMESMKNDRRNMGRLNAAPLTAAFGEAGPV